MARPCPHCSKPMKPDGFQGVGLEECPDGAGFWFEGDELRDLIARDPSGFVDLEKSVGATATEQRPGPESPRLCPNGHNRLQQYHYMYNSPVVLETCNTCGGVWVDTGELEKMQAWHDQALGPMTPQQEAQLVLAQATVEHDSEMAKQQGLQSFFTALGRFQPGWTGFFP